MILEIALGVCFGIVLAALVLRYWHQLIAGSLTVIVGGLLIGSLIFLGPFVWSNFAKIAAVAGVVAGLAVLYSVPFWLIGRVSSAYPAFSAFVKDDPTIRLVVLVIFAALSFGALLGGIALIEYVGSLAAPK